MSDKKEQAAPDQAVEDVIADCGGDARVAVAELLAIIRCLIHENQTLREARLRPASHVTAQPLLAGRNDAHTGRHVRL